MEHRFETHGLDFVVDATGFGNASGDFRTTCDIIEAKLDVMDADEVRRLHAADIASVEQGEAAQDLNRIAQMAASDVTRGWHNADNICITLNAIPRGEA